MLELYDLEIHQKKAEFDYHSLKTMVKRSIEHSLRKKNFEARNGNFERCAVVKNQRDKNSVNQRSLGDCWQWKANGQCSKGDNCSSPHDKDKRAKSTQPNPSPSSSTRQNEGNASENQKVLEAEAQVGKWLDCRARITPKELAELHSVKSGTLRQNTCSTRQKMDANLGISALTYTARLTNSLAKSLKNEW